MITSKASINTTLDLWNNRKVSRLTLTLPRQIQIRSSMTKYLRKQLKVSFHLSLLTNSRLFPQTRLQNGMRLEIESSKEYVDLGFAPDYTFVLASENIQRRFLSDLKSKMFNDAADSGEEEFEKSITNFDTDLFINFRMVVSYKAIQLLPKKEELIQILRNLNIKLHCHDGRLAQEIVANYDDVIYR